MSKLKITPDIAELIGTYMEGGFLTSEELQIVHSVMNEDFMSHHLDIDPIIDDTQLSAISPIDTDVAIGTNLLSAAFAIDTIPFHPRYYASRFNHRRCYSFPRLGFWRHYSATKRHMRHQVAADYPAHLRH